MISGFKVIDSDPNTWPQCGPEEIWLPGKHLDSDYPIPSDAEMAKLWQRHMGVGEAITTKEVFGVFTPPTHTVKAIASIDLCEVLRETQQAIYSATSVKANHNSKYSSGTWYDPDIVGTSYERSIVKSVARVLIGNGLVKPVQGIQKITKILKGWRAAGVWVIANTSTLPGCEPGTIEHTLAKSAEQQFDGIVLPRNHDGNGVVTKAAALRAIMREAEIKDTTPVVHIDDADYHHAGFRATANSFSRLALVAPMYNNEPVPNAHYQLPSSLQAFIRTNEILNSIGVAT